MKMTGHPTVDAIGQLNFEGHLVPHTWYEHLTYENKRGTYCHHLAILMLADIVYWYRPILIKDESSGQIVTWRKKFAADKLQRSYQAFSQQLRATDRQIREAALFLKNMGLIDLEFRTVTTPSGLTLANVLYIGCNPNEIARITFTRRGITEIGDTVTLDVGVSPKSVTPQIEISDTTNRNQEQLKPKSGSTLYTKISPEITTETTHTEAPPEPGAPPTQEENVCVDASQSQEEYGAIENLSAGYKGNEQGSREENVCFPLRLDPAATAPQKAEFIAARKKIKVHLGAAASVASGLSRYPHWAPDASDDEKAKFLKFKEDYFVSERLCTRLGAPEMALNWVAKDHTRATEGFLAWQQSLTPVNTGEQLRVLPFLPNFATQSLAWHQELAALYQGLGEQNFLAQEPWHKFWLVHARKFLIKKGIQL